MVKTEIFPWIFEQCVAPVSVSRIFSLLFFFSYRCPQVNIKSVNKPPKITCFYWHLDFIRWGAFYRFSPKLLNKCILIKFVAGEKIWKNKLGGWLLYLYVTGYPFFLNFHAKFFSSFLCSPPVGLNFIDHIVGNQPDDEMVPISDW